MVLAVKNLPASAGNLRDAGWILGREDPLEEGIATHFSILGWRILWTEEPGGLQSMGSQAVRCNWTDLACTHVLESLQSLSPSYQVGNNLIPNKEFDISHYCHPHGVDKGARVLRSTRFSGCLFSHWISSVISTAETSTISDHMISSNTGSSAASFIYLFLNLFTWLCLVLVVACEIFNLACSTQNFFFSSYSIQTPSCCR